MRAEDFTIWGNFATLGSRYTTRIPINIIPIWILHRTLRRTAGRHDEDFLIKVFERYLNPNRPVIRKHLIDKILFSYFYWDFQNTESHSTDVWLIISFRCVDIIISAIWEKYINSNNNIAILVEEGYINCRQAN